MLKFIAGFPPRLCREIFLLNTRAGMKLYKIFMPGLSGLALIFPAFMLWLKGYKCIGFRPVDLPSNWIPLHPGLRKKVIESIFKRCEPIVRHFGNKILSGGKVYMGLFSLPVDLLISPVAVGYYIGGRFFLSKTFIANDKCNNCGICIKECPTSSIKLVRNRPYWKLTCESCMRCLNNCPERAIEAAHGMATVFMILITAINTKLILLLVNSLNILPEVWWWKVLSQIIGIVVMVFSAALLYLIMHYAMGIKPVRLLVRFTSLTTLPFWRRYKYLKEKKNHNNTSANS
jgi:Pyruvate/2-oxoacid:ferredoxin oxidoreductase delta subunit